MWKEIKLQLCAGYLFIYFTVNMMAFAIAVSQQYYDFAVAEVKKQVSKC